MVFKGSQFWRHRVYGEGKSAVRENMAAVMESPHRRYREEKVGGPRLQTRSPVTYFLQTLQSFQIDQQPGTKGSNT